MAWTEYMTVRSSTVYENKGLAKPLLSLIAMLVERAEDGEEPTENEGWCYASERYLAESLGMSESQACKWIKVFVRDGWLVIDKKQDERGYHRNRYRLAENVMGRMEKLKRQRGAERDKNPNKVRPPEKNPLRRARSGEEIVSTLLPGDNPLNARSGEASTLGAEGPSRSEQSGLPARSASRSGGRSSSEKSDEIVRQTEGGPASASQRENPKTQEVKRAEGGELRSPAPQRRQETTGGRPSVPPPTSQRAHDAMCWESSLCVTESSDKSLVCNCWCHSCEHKDTRRAWKDGLIAHPQQKCECGKKFTDLFIDWTVKKIEFAAMETAAQ